MHIGHLLGAVVVVYEGVVGVTEIYMATSTGEANSNATLASIGNLPTVGSMVIGSTGGGGTTAGVVDLGVAALIYFFFLHKHLFG